MATTMKLIAKAIAGSGGATEFDLQSIPATYTDLLVVLSVRTSATATAQSTSNFMKVNNATTSLDYRTLLANGGGVSSFVGVASGYTGNEIGTVPGTSVTASTFTSSEIYFPNYAGSTNKSYSVTAVTENNSGTNYTLQLYAGMRSNTAAIDRLTFYPGSGSYVQHSSVFLYGITRSDDNTPGTFGIQATGGDEVFIANGYKVHVFKSSGTFTVNSPGFVEYLVVGGGGGGGATAGGGGGAGGYRSSVGVESSGGGAIGEPRPLLKTGTYSVVVGAGGAGGAGNNIDGTAASGNSSVFGSIATSDGGGGGGGAAGITPPRIGGSGGGGNNYQSPASGLSGQGYSGGAFFDAAGNGTNGGGGGGAAAVGGSANDSKGGDGGAGVSSNITGTSITRAGGGGAGSDTSGRSGGTGGSGGGANGLASGNASVGNSGTANTGGGGGGSGGLSGSFYGGNGGNGGSGIVIIRYPVT